MAHCMFNLKFTKHGVRISGQPSIKTKRAKSKEFNENYEELVRHDEREKEVHAHRLRYLNSLRPQSALSQVTALSGMRSRKSAATAAKKNF